MLVLRFLPMVLGTLGVSDDMSVRDLGCALPAQSGAEPALSEAGAGS